MVDRTPSAFLDKNNFRLRLVEVTFDSRQGFKDSTTLLSFFTDQIKEAQCVNNTFGWLTTKYAHSNRLHVERFCLNPHQDLPGIIVAADDQTVRRTFDDDSSLFSNMELQARQGWTPWFISNVLKLKSKGNTRYEGLRDKLSGSIKLGEINQRLTFAKHPIELNDRYRDLVVAAVDGDVGLDAERWGSKRDNWVCPPSSDSKRANALKRDILPYPYYIANSSNFVFPGGTVVDFLWAAELCALPEADATRAESNRRQFGLTALTMFDRVHQPCSAMYLDEPGLDLACILGTLPLGTFGVRWAGDLETPILNKIAHPRDPIGSTIGEEVVMSQFVRNGAPPIFLGVLVDVASTYYDMPYLACGTETSIQASLGRLSVTLDTPKSPIFRKVASFAGCMSHCSILVIGTGSSLFQLHFLNNRGEQRGRGNYEHRFPTWLLVGDLESLLEEYRQFFLNIKMRYYCINWMPPDPNLYKVLPNCETSNGRICNSAYAEQYWERVNAIGREIGIRIGRADLYHGDSYTWRAPWNLGASDQFINSCLKNQRSSCPLQTVVHPQKECNGENERTIKVAAARYGELNAIYQDLSRAQETVYGGAMWNRSRPHWYNSNEPGRLNVWIFSTQPRSVDALAAVVQDVQILDLNVETSLFDTDYVPHDIAETSGAQASGASSAGAQLSVKFEETDEFELEPLHLQKTEATPLDRARRAMAHSAKIEVEKVETKIEHSSSAGDLHAVPSVPAGPVRAAETYLSGDRIPATPPREQSGASSGSGGNASTPKPEDVAQDLPKSNESRAAAQPGACPVTTGPTLAPIDEEIVEDVINDRLPFDISSSPLCRPIEVSGTGSQDDPTALNIIIGSLNLVNPADIKLIVSETAIRDSYVGLGHPVGDHGFPEPWTHTTGCCTASIDIREVESVEVPYGRTEENDGDVAKAKFTELMQSQYDLACATRDIQIMDGDNNVMRENVFGRRTVTRFHGGNQFISPWSPIPYEFANLYTVLFDWFISVLSARGCRVLLTCSSCDELSE